MRWVLIPLTVAVFVSGCGTMTPEDFSHNRPKFDLYEYFAGDTRAWGIFEDRFGRVRRQFEVEIRGRLEDGDLVLEEDFLYLDGERDRRVWRISRDGPQAYIGRAADVVGEAEGRAMGNALNWRYDMDLKVGDGTWRVHFDDWMFRHSNGVVINRAKVTKFGLDLGSVTLFFKKSTPESEAASAVAQ